MISKSAVNTEAQVETKVRCSIILPGGNDSSKLNAYLCKLGEMSLSSDYEAVVINDQRLQIDENRFRVFLPALKIVNTDGPLRQEQIFDRGAMAASGEYLLFIRNFMAFDSLVLEESISDLARKVSRHIKNVYEDIKVLEDLNMIVLRKGSAKKIIPEILVEEIIYPIS